jgi:hypothetical protein
MNLGWWNGVAELEKLEGALLLHGFRPELYQHLSTESAKDSVQPWRYKSDGTVYSYFVYPSQEAYELRATLALSETTGRLRLVVGGAGAACIGEVFATERQALMSEVALSIGDHFSRKATFQYDKGERC